MDLHGHHIISEITNLCMNFIISSSFLQWPSQNMSNGAKKLKFKISLIFHKKDYSMSNLEQSKVQGNLKRQIQHTLDPGLFSSSLVMMVQPLLWAWKGVRCKKPLDNYIIDVWAFLVFCLLQRKVRQSLQKVVTHGGVIGAESLVSLGSLVLISAKNGCK